MPIIYFVFQINTPNKCKIGYTSDFSSRISGLQVGNPDKLEIHKFIETDNPIELEKFIHSQLNIFHIQGEWFKITKEQVDHIIESIDVDNFKCKPKTVNKVDKEIANTLTNINDNIYTCEICEKDFKHRGALWKHANRKKTACVPQQRVVEIVEELKAKINKNVQLKQENDELKQEKQQLRQDNQTKKEQIDKLTTVIISKLCE